MKRKAKWIWWGIGFSIFLVIIFVYSFREPILLQVGYFLAPHEDIATADVAIIEGGQGLETGAVNAAMNMLSSGRTSRVVVVIHQISENKRQFAIDEDYPDLVRNKFKVLGLSEKQFIVIVAPVNHPITLIEAAIVLETLSKEDVKDALLLTNGFHTRRSMLVYQYVGQKYDIKIIPVPYFNDYQLSDWWTHEEGLKEFVSESIKLFYYQARGYIPLKF